jgi:hypothetical protein
MIPELLTTLSGERVSTVRDWEDFRKEEIAELEQMVEEHRRQKAEEYEAKLQQAKTE